MKINIVTEKDVSIAELINGTECTDDDVNIKDIIHSISNRYEDYAVDSKIVNTGITVMLNCSPSIDDLKNINIENLAKLLKILGYEISKS